MNAIQVLFSEPWIERLGWTLVHFLWQGLSIAVLYAAARRVMARTASPSTRYLLACAALTAMMAAPLVTWWLLPPADASRDAAYRIQYAPTTAPTAVVGTASLPASVRSTLPSISPAQFLPWVVMAWLAGAVVFWVRLAGGWVVAARMRSMLVRRAPPEWQENLRQLGARIGLSRPVRLLVSALVQVPTVVGWLRPVVLVPVGALSGLPAEHLEALLLHELAHIRRHDYLVNLLQSIAEALLFYQPAVWWVSGHIRTERELCCDDVAVSVSGDAFTYARALSQLESYRPAHFDTAVAANGGFLSDRIARLLGQSRPAVRTGPGPGVFAVAILLVAAAYGLFGQAEAHPAFEVASIRRCAPAPTGSSRSGMGVTPGKLEVSCTSVMSLIHAAYVTFIDDRDGTIFGPDPILGGPAWIKSDQYDIQAKADGTPSGQTMQGPMLQALLEERFKLKIHRETREIPVYDLTVAKGGFKLQALKDGACTPLDPTKPSDIFSMTPAEFKTLASKSCGTVMPGANSGANFNGMSLDEIFRWLSRNPERLDRPVINKSGITGLFNVYLEFALDPSTSASRLRALALQGDAPQGNVPDDPLGGQSIFTAVQGQLGLKLEPAKGPGTFLVIDSVERPSEN